jgi:hypothetical protein
LGVQRKIGDDLECRVAFEGCLSPSIFKGPSIETDGAHGRSLFCMVVVAGFGWGACAATTGVSLLGWWLGMPAAGWWRRRYRG